MNIWIYIFIYGFILLLTYKYVHMCLSMYTLMTVWDIHSTYNHAYAYIHMHVHIHTHISAHVHTHAHAHAHTPAQKSANPTKHLPGDVGLDPKASRSVPASNPPCKWHVQHWASHKMADYGFSFACSRCNVAERRQPPWWFVERAGGWREGLLG